jgi:hypothetical protein
MGNSVLLKMTGCCSKDNNIEMKDIYIVKNISDNNQYIIDQNNSHIINNKETQNKIEKLVQTKSKHSSGSGSLIKTKHFYMGESSSSNNNANASICNNTFQISNSNIFKNNLVQNNLNNYQKINPIDELRHKNSIINFNKFNTNLKDKAYEIKTKLVLSGDLFSNETIEINKYGMKNGLRQKNDGLTIFGLKENIDIPNIHSCDYYFSDFENIDENENRKITGKVFEIYLNKKDKKYTLYFLHNSLILYYKIKNDVFLNLDKDYFLILGDIFLTVHIKRNSSNNQKMIHIQADFENEKPKKYVFSPSETPIKIGRVNCQVEIKKPSISKLHSIIDYKNDNFYYKDCGSTNGSTLLIREDDSLKIKGKMSLKLGDISFKITEVEDDNHIIE